MAWLIKQQPIELYQSSELPYVILENGVHLCYDNCYGQQRDNADHNIHFTVQANFLKRINTHYYKFELFPVTIPFTDIISLDDTIIKGCTIKHIANVQADSLKLAVIQSEYIRNISENELYDFNNKLDDFDHNFILTGESIDPQTRLFDNVSTIIHHFNWYRTFVTIANQICTLNNREYEWTKSIPEISISYYGLPDSDDISKWDPVFENVGLCVSTKWAK